MKRRILFPIRLKILIGVLLVVTAVVSVITFTMATLFHDDKRVYIRDLISLVGTGTAEEAESLLIGYGERIEVCARIAGDGALERQEKSRLLQGLFTDFPELVGLTLYRGDKESFSVYDRELLAEFGLTEQDVLATLAEHPLPLERIRSGQVHVRNSTMVADFPVMTIAVAPDANAAGDVVIVGLTRLDDLQQLASRNLLFEISLADADGVLLAHRDTARVAARESAPLGDGAQGAGQQTTMGRLVEYERDGIKMLAAYAGVPYGGVTATAQIPVSAAYLASRELLSRLMVVSLALLALTALVALVGAHRLTRPVERLSDATKEIAKGRFEIRVPEAGHDEIAALAGSFNHMAGELRSREDALQAAQTQLMQSAKMAAFGELGAGIAHEVKNPLAGILGCAQLSLRKIEPGSALHKNLVLIEKETKRCKAIIENLLRFARQEKAIHEPISLNKAVEDAIAIVHHQMEISQVKLEWNLAEDLPEISGNANQLQQVVMNLIMNAQQAMESEPGIVTVATRRDGDSHVEIRVRDNGPGMTREVREKIFEPFFTTKPSGKGTGLGLSVSFGIVEDHSGEIRVESDPGQGTEFIIRLPVPREHAVIEQLGTIVERTATQARP